MGPSGGGGPSMWAIASPEPPISTAAPRSRAILVFLDSIEVSLGRHRSSKRHVVPGTMAEQKVIVANCTVNIPPANFAIGPFAPTWGADQITVMIKEETKPHIL